MRRTAGVRVKYMGGSVGGWVRGAKWLEGKGKGHVYEIGMWHFKLSAEVKICASTHAHAQIFVSALSFFMVSILHTHTHTRTPERVRFDRCVLFR